MPQTFSCPNCGGSAEYTGGPTARCQYCNNLVTAPPELRQEDLQQQATQTASKAGRYFLIFLLIVVGIPSCLGLIGTLIGVFFGIAGPILAVIIQLLVK